MFDRFKKIVEDSSYKFNLSISDQENFEANANFNDQRKLSLRQLFHSYVELLMSSNLETESKFIFMFIRDSNWLVNE